jgi:hypothetical protein
MNLSIVSTEEPKLNDPKKLLRVSNILSARNSLEHFKYFALDQGEREPSKAMEFGTMVHARILEPHLFFDKYVCPGEINLESAPETIEELTAYLLNQGQEVPKDKRKPNLIAQIRAREPEFKTKKELIESTINGRKCVDYPIWKAVEALDKSVREKTRIDRMLEGAVIEQRLYGIFEDDSEFAMTGQPDAVNANLIENEVVIFDLKTTKSVVPREFLRSAYNFGYLGQAAAYCDLVAKKYSVPPESVKFYWIAVESFAPYSVGVFSADQNMVENGRMMYRSLLRKIKKGFLENKWSGPAGDDPIDLILEEWMVRDMYQNFGEGMFDGI